MPIPVGVLSIVPGTTGTVGIIGTAGVCGTLGTGAGMRRHGIIPHTRGTGVGTHGGAVRHIIRGGVRRGAGHGVAIIPVIIHLPVPGTDRRIHLRDHIVRIARVQEIMPEEHVPEVIVAILPTVVPAQETLKVTMAIVAVTAVHVRRVPIRPEPSHFPEQETIIPAAHLSVVRRAIPGHQPATVAGLPGQTLRQ